jgi:hypothetical protein
VLSLGTQQKFKQTTVVAYDVIITSVSRPTASNPESLTDVEPGTAGNVEGVKGGVRHALPL